MISPAGWIARLQRLGAAYFGVLRAEVQAALADLNATGRSVARAGLLLTVTIAMGFWTVGLLVYFLIEILALWLPRWGAVGAVFGLFVLITATLGALFARRVRAIESPTAMIGRRFDEHTTWWRRQMTGSEERVTSAPVANDEDEWDER